MLVADGRLVERDGAYQPSGELGDIAVPDTLTALIAARLDGSEAQDRGADLRRGGARTELLERGPRRTRRIGTLRPSISD